jgi:hypothetical protein
MRILSKEFCKNIHVPPKYMEVVKNICENNYTDFLIIEILNQVIVLIGKQQFDIDESHVFYKMYKPGNLANTVNNSFVLNLQQIASSII